MNTTILDKCQHLSEVKILSEILKTYNRETLAWTHTRSTRMAICEILQMSEISFKVRLNNMHKNGILVKVDRGLYKVNEEFISYGSK